MPIATPSPWDPRQYDRFKAERSQPFFDLVDLLRPRPAPRVVDLGCGTGELTAALVARLGATEVLGLDNAETMLAEARGRAGGTLRFDHADIATFHEPGAWDVLLSNAALQWLPDHAAVLARWVASLRPGGQLAVQVPANAYMPSHLVADELAHTEPYLSAFEGAPPPDPVAEHVLQPEQYAQILFDLGCERQHVRLQVYPHVLANTRDIVQWVRGTTLTRFQKRLPADVFERFVADYEAELLARIGERSPCFFPFRRILFWGRTAGSTPMAVR